MAEFAFAWVTMTWCQPNTDTDGFDNSLPRALFWSNPALWLSTVITWHYYGWICVTSWFRSNKYYKALVLALPIEGPDLNLFRRPYYWRHAVRTFVLALRSVCEDIAHGSGGITISSDVFVSPLCKAPNLIHFLWTKLDLQCVEILFEILHIKGL